jgi:hypothetical protein
MNACQSAWKDVRDKQVTCAIIPRRARRVITAGTSTDPLGLAINGRAKTPEKKKYGREDDGFIHYDFS